MPEPVEIYTEEYYDRLKQIESDHWWTLGMTDIMDQLLSRHLPATGGRFLDVGCGSGIGLRWARERLPSAHRIGFDISSYAIERCANLGAGLFLASAGDLPLADSSVDVAICLDVLQHLEDERPTLREIRRVLKPDGIVFIRTNALSLAPPPPGSRLFTRPLLLERLSEAGLIARQCSAVNLVGSLYAEVGMWRQRRAENTGHHGHDHHGHHDQHEHRKHDEPFHGGGYGGGLRITTDRGPKLAQRIKRALLRLESHAIVLGLRMPFGHSLIALAQPASDDAVSVY